MHVKDRCKMFFSPNVAIWGMKYKLPISTLRSNFGIVCKGEKCGCLIEVNQFKDTFSEITNPKKNLKKYSAPGA